MKLPTLHPAARLAFILGVVAALTIPLSAAQISTTWTGDASENWNDAGNWTNGVPNNAGPDTFVAIVDSSSDTNSINASTPIAIDELHLLVGSVTFAADLNTISGVLDNEGTIDLSGFNSVSLTAGSLAQQVGTTLTGGSYDLSTISTEATATLSWAGADIHTIGEAASINLARPGSAMLDSTSGLSALRNLKKVDGRLDIAFQDHAYSNGLTIGDQGTVSLSNGTHTVTGSLDNTGSLYLDSFVLGGLGGGTTILTADSLAQQVGTTLIGGSFSINKSDDAATATILSWTGADIQTIGEGASVTLDGMGTAIQDKATSLSALRNLHQVDGNFSLVYRSDALTGSLGIGEDGSVLFQNGNYSIGGTVTNLGGLSIVNATLAVGSVPLLGGTTLESGSFYLSDYLGTGSTLSWPGADIQIIGETAAVTLSDANSAIKNSTTGLSALANLHQVDGGLTLVSQSHVFGAGLTIGETGTVNLSDGSFPVTGNLSVNGSLMLVGTMDVSGSLSNAGMISISDYGAGTNSITAAGPLLQQVDHVLTAGSFDLSAYNTASAIVSWSGADIQVIGEDASISLGGTSSLQDSATHESALRNLREVDGSLYLGNAQPFMAGLVIGGNGSATLSTSYFSDTKMWTGTYPLTGNLTNAGSLYVTGEMPVSGILSNTGYISVNNYAPVVSSSSITAAGLAQQVGNTLTAGSYSVSGRDGAVAFIGWADADIHVIGLDATVDLDGALASLKDTTSGLSALRNLSEIDGRLSLSEQTLTFAGPLTIGSGGSLSVSLNGTLQIGNLSNEGSIFSNAYTFDASNVSAVVHINGTVAQQSGFTLTGGSWDVSSSANDSGISTATIEWAGADIRIIGENASVSIDGDGASLKDAATGMSALRNLAEVDGSLYLSGQNFAFTNGLKIGTQGSVTLAGGSYTASGMLDNAGWLEVGSYSSSSETIVFDGLVQQTGTTLSGGSYFVNGYDATTVLSWAGAAIQTIDESARVSLSGSFASIRNSQNNADALAGLSVVNGSLSLSDRDLAVSGGLNVGSNGSIYVSGDTELAIAGSLSNTGSVSTDAYTYDDTVNTIVHINGTVAQQSGNVLTGGSWSASSFASNTGVANAIIEWAGADIHTIASGASVSLYGPNAIIKDSTSGMSALRNLSEIDGDLYITQQNLATPGMLSIGEHGSLNVSNANVTVAGSFSNDGYFSVGASTYNSENPNFTFHVDGAVIQQSGTTLTGGDWYASAEDSDSSTVTATIEWVGADIHTIGSGASISLEGPGASIKDSTGGMSALRNLAEIDGYLSIRNHSLSTTGGLVVESTGTLSLSGAQLAPGGSIIVNGELAITGTQASTLATSLSFSSAGTYQINFAALYDSHTGDTTGIATGGLDINGTAFLGGMLYLTLDDVYSSLTPDAASQYEILSATALNGFFLNAMNGSRVDVTKYDYDIDMNTTVGTFAVSYAGGNITVGDFQPVPEPATWTLLLAGVVLVLWRARRRRIEGH